MSNFIPSNIRHAAHGMFTNVVEAVTPVPTKSKFDEKRLLTPDEFVTAGDHLVSTVGSWEWAAGDAKLRKNYLPADKQYLVTRNVPCKQRVVDVMGDYKETTDGPEGDDQWVVPQNPAGKEAQTQENDIAGADDEDDDTFVPSTATSAHRSYDLYITYDKYYQVPRFWLVGFDSTRTHLSIKQMQEDVSADHMAETVTVDPFPHQKALKAMSIHPCQHAHTMQVLTHSDREFPVQQYLFLFLKFIAGVVPTIEYDYSMEFGM
eukprot:TRINITY_DN8658_c0_g1_i1.p1 TRINITY_DN8658_c0_g1~~TRINITY_DN8658_c0_g1_i1.p1  ORF type:complete len:262 (-),score=27.81 TRINITY_DN8658_c0_g1_i1:96-881(-)